MKFAKLRKKCKNKKWLERKRREYIFKEYDLSQSVVPLNKGDENKNRIAKKISQIQRFIGRLDG